MIAPGSLAVCHRWAGRGPSPWHLVRLEEPASPRLGEDVWHGKPLCHATATLWKPGRVVAAPTQVCVFCLRKQYAADMDILPEVGRARGIAARERIVQRITESPGTTPARVARDIGLRRSTVAYHLQILERAHRVVARHDGRAVRLYVEGQAPNEPPTTSAS
jgi:DNA-binding transcriptional ArsR family regulator